jgi:hypothetical protein
MLVSIFVEHTFLAVFTARNRSLKKIAWVLSQGPHVIFAFSSLCFHKIQQDIEVRGARNVVRPFLG